MKSSPTVTREDSAFEIPCHEILSDSPGPRGITEELQTCPRRTTPRTITTRGHMELTVDTTACRRGSIPLRHSNGSKSFALTFIFADYCSQGVGPMRLLPFLTLAAPSSAAAYCHLPTSARKGQLRQVLRPSGSLRLLLLLLWTRRDRLLLRLEYIRGTRPCDFLLPSSRLCLQAARPPRYRP